MSRVMSPVKSSVDELEVADTLSVLSTPVKREKRPAESEYQSFNDFFCYKSKVATGFGAIFNNCMSGFLLRDIPLNTEFETIYMNYITGEAIFTPPHPKAESYIGTLIYVIGELSSKVVNDDTVKRLMGYATAAPSDKRNRFRFPEHTCYGYFRFSSCKHIFDNDWLFTDCRMARADVPPLEIGRKFSNVFWLPSRCMVIFYCDELRTPYMIYAPLNTVISGIQKYEE